MPEPKARQYRPKHGFFGQIGRRFLSPETEYESEVTKETEERPDYSPGAEKGPQSPEDFKRQQKKALEGIPGMERMEQKPGQRSAAGAAYSVFEDPRLPGVTYLLRAGSRDELNDLARQFGQNFPHLREGFESGALQMDSYDNSDELLRQLGPRLAVRGAEGEGAPAEEGLPRDRQARMAKVGERFDAMMGSADEGGPRPSRLARRLRALKEADV